MFWYDKILYPIEVVVAYIMWFIHEGLIKMGVPDGGLVGAWSLSIIGLTIFVRILIIPLFFKQIKSSRNMQLIQPEMKKIQQKYKGKKDPESRRRQSEETMALYKKHNANPMSSCMPMLLQMPIFFALFSVLRLTKEFAGLEVGKNIEGYTHIGPLDRELAIEIEKSSFFGAPLSDSFMESSEISVKIVAAIMVIAMAVTMFLTMRQLTMKNMPESAKDDDNPMMRTQKMMMYFMPIVMGISGIYFQIGVVIYWLTSNIWSTGQQYYTISRMPAPGSEAAKKLEAKNKVKYGKFKDKIDAKYEALLEAVEPSGNYIDEVDKIEANKLAELKKKRIKLGLERPEPKKPVVDISTSERIKRVQPKKLSRAQRQLAEESVSGKKDSSGKGNLTPEQIEKRRQERRAAVRRKKKKR